MVPPPIRPSLHFVLVALTLAALWLTGCSLYQVRQEDETINNSVILVGTVTGTEQQGPVVVAAYRRDGRERQIAHHTVLEEPGPYELIVPQGDYFLFAFADRNRDLTYQAEEPAGQYRDQKLVVARSSGVMVNLNIALASAGQAATDLPPGTVVASRGPGPLHYTSPGTVVDLQDPLYDYDHGLKGYWQPLEFFQEFGGNIYFLQPYDPAKVPVLFVHGATGTPRGWNNLVSQLDPDRYQPWVYFYPSGASLKAMGDLLFWKIYNLQARYRFPEMAIVAHSMGGLVTRSFLVDYGQQFPSIKKFISISTPWSGDSLSEMGVKYSPGVIPAWRDLGLQSAFIEAIYRKPLPPTLDFYLLFGHEGNRNPLRPNNDGVVTLESQLDPRVEAEAKMIYGFKEDHDSILTSRAVATLVNTILGRKDRPGSTDSADQGGRLALTCHLEEARRGDLAGAQLYLLPAGKSAEEGIFFTLGAGRTADYGPIPPGQYQLSLLAATFRTEPQSRTIIVTADQATEISLKPRPDGAIVDHVRQTFYPDQDPAGTYVLPSEDVTLKSVHLSGPGIDRTLVPTTDRGFNWIEAARARRDWAYGTIFAFYGLPAGEYRLTVEAEGFAPIRVARTVVPGRPNVHNGIVLPPSP